MRFRLLLPLALCAASLATAQSLRLAATRVMPGSSPEYETMSDAVRMADGSIWIFATIMMRHDSIVGRGEHDITIRVGYVLSKDGGATWDTVSWIPRSDTSYYNDASGGVDTAGNLFVLYMHDTKADPPYRLWLQRSTDGGADWSTPACIWRDSNDHPFLAVDHGSGSPYEGYLYAVVEGWDTSRPVWGHIDAQTGLLKTDTCAAIVKPRILVLRSTDHGASFQKVGAFNESTTSNPFGFAEISVGSDGTVCVSWMQGSEPQMDYSTDGGATWNSGLMPLDLSDRCPSAVTKGDTALYGYAPVTTYQGTAIDTTPYHGVHGQPLVVLEHKEGTRRWFYSAEIVNAAKPAVACAGDTNPAHLRLSPARVLDSSGKHLVWGIGQFGDTVWNWAYTGVRYEPRLTVDSAGVLYCAFLQADTMLDPSFFWNQRVRIFRSTDHGATWSPGVTLSAGTRSASTNGIDYFGLTSVGSRVFCLYSDGAWASTPQAWFVEYEPGTQLRSEFDGTYQKRLVYNVRGHTNRDTILSRGIVAFPVDTVYAQPEFARYDSVNDSAHNNFEFWVWNNAGDPRWKTTVFNHSFMGVGTATDVQEANFAHVDSLVARNDLEGGEGSTLRWGIGATPSFTTDSSPVRIDTAFRGRLGQYSFIAKDSLPRTYRSSWYLEGFSVNGVFQTPVSDTLGFYEPTGPTHISALFKGHLRSADALGALDFNNGRKACWGAPEGRHFLTYESRGNIYAARSTGAAFCDFEKEIKLNTTYGNAADPAIAYLDRPDPDSVHSPMKIVYVAWDERDSISGGWHWRVMLRARDGAGAWQAPTVADSFDTPLANVDRPAPSVCAAQSTDGYTISQQVRGALAWHRDSSVWVAIITNTNAAGARRIIDTAFHGSYVTIEPGYWGIDSVGVAAHRVDFNVAFHDTSMGDHGYAGGLRYRYLIYDTATGWAAPYPTNMVMNNYWVDSPKAPWGLPQHPSLCVGADAGHPVVVAYILNELCSYLAMPYDTNSWLQKRRSGMYTRLLSGVGGTWGLFRIMAKYTANPVLAAPSVTCNSDARGSYMAAWFKHDDAGPSSVTDSIQHGTWPYTDPTAGASGRDYYPDSTRVICTERARTPQLEYNQKVTRADSGILCNRMYHVPDTNYPRVIRRSNVNCTVSDNRNTTTRQGWDELTVVVDSVAKVGLSVGEFRIVDSTGASSGVPMMQEMMLKPAATPADILAVNGSAYFRLPAKAHQFIWFRAPSISDTAHFARFTGTKSVTFTTMLVDSARGVPVVPLDQQMFRNTGAVTACGFDTTLVDTLAGQNRTFYVVTKIDTGSGFADLRFSLARVNSEDKLSDILAPGSGLGKEAMRFAGRAGMVPEGYNPIELAVFPNPFNPRTSIAFSVPTEDASDVAQVRVFDIRGTDIATLLHEIKPAGRYTLSFYGHDLPSGQYVVSVWLRNHMQSRLMELTR